MCNCTKGKSIAKKYEVKYPNGAKETKTNEVAAKLAAGRVPGATYAAVAS